MTNNPEPRKCGWCQEPVPVDKLLAYCSDEHRNRSVLYRDRCDGVKS